jgi:hypothetical protein
MTLEFITSRLPFSLLILVATIVVAYFASTNGDPSFREMLVPRTTIDQILERPSQYDGKIVKVDGVVVGSFGVMGLGGFRFKDPGGGREILVVTSDGLPSAGNPILVVGRFKQALSIGGCQYAVIFQGF